MLHNKYKPLVIAVSFLSSGYTLPTFAQEVRSLQLEEVIVTAQRRQESLSEVPIAVSALTADMLSQRGIGDTASLTEVVPSVQLTTSGPSSMFFVRGVGNTNGGVGEEGANAFYVDGVYMPDLLQSVMKFNNIERVEVLKGPQGTLFGRNSTGGLVQVITKEPTEEFTGNISVGAANYDTYSTQAYVAGGLTETVKADLAISYSDQGEGWGENLITGDDVAKRRDWGLRSKVVWEPTDAAKITFAGEYGELKDDRATNWYIAPGTFGLSPQPGVLPSTPSPGDDFDTTATNPQFTDMTLYGGSVTAEIDLDWATFTSITAYRKMESDSGVDVDGGPLPLIAFHLEETANETYQQELRLASNSEGPFGWQAGMFYLNAKASMTPQSSSGLLFAPISRMLDYVEQDTQSISGFGEVNYYLTDATQIIAGLRYTKDERDFKGLQERYVSGLATPVQTVTDNDSTTDEEMSYRLALRHNLTDDTNLYASWNRSFKSGLFTMNSYPWGQVAPQTIDALEVGMKTSHFGNRLRVNAAVFYYEIDDYQARAVINNAQALQNAAKVEVEGVELEFEALLGQGLTLFGSATYTNSEFAEFPNATSLIPNPAFVGGNANGPVIDAKGNETPIAPNFAGSVGVSYAVPVADGELRMNALYSYNSGYYFDTENRLEQPSFSTVNASIGYYPTPDWGVEVWGRNLTDERHYIQRLGSNLSDMDVRAAPRTYGVTLNYHF
jgi:iron complex outermembrane receptor protein